MNEGCSIFELLESSLIFGGCYLHCTIVFQLVFVSKSISRVIECQIGHLPFLCPVLLKFWTLIVPIFIHVLTCPVLVHGLLFQ